MQELSVRIREKRGLRGMRDIAKEIGISPATLSRIETGKQPDIGTFSKLCRWLNIDPNTILGISSSDTGQNQTSNNQFIYASFRADKELNQYEQTVNEDKLKLQLSQIVNETLLKELKHWMTEANLDYELFNFRLGKRIKYLESKRFDL